MGKFAEMLKIVVDSQKQFGKVMASRVKQSLNDEFDTKLELDVAVLMPTEI